MPELAALIYPDGPSVSPAQPDKRKIREWGTWVEGIIAAFFGSGGKIYQTKAALTADLVPAANSSAWVMEDPVAANNGVYRKVGGTGTGSWVRAGDLPFSFIVANDAGAGTPNAIQATTAIPVSNSALIWVEIADTNTGTPVTISFNSGSAKTIKTNSGGNVAVGGLTAGMIVLGIQSGSTFRLVSDQASSAIIAEVEAIAETAATAAAAAIAAAGVLGTTITVESVPAWAMRKALVAVSPDTYYAVESSVPADPTNDVNIHWATAWPIAPGNTLYSHIQSTLGYSSGQMDDLMDSARSQTL